MGSLSLLQEIFLIQGLNPCLPHCRQILYHLSHQAYIYPIFWAPFDERFFSPVNWVCNFSKTSCPYMCMSIFRFSILFPLSTFANIKMVSISMLLLLLSRFRRQPTRLPHPWDSPGKNTGLGCHFLLQCINVKSQMKLLSHVRLLATSWTAAH